MYKSVVRLAIVACAMTLALCGAAAATDSTPPPWLGDSETNSYVWNTWGDNLFATNFTANPDAIIGTGSGIASILVGDYGAGLLSGSAFAIGNVDTYIELGQAGSIHLDVTPDSRGMDLWIEVLYDEDITAAPQISVNGAIRLLGTQVITDDASLDALTPSQWTRYEFLWRVDAAHVTQFQGIDIVADSRIGVQRCRGVGSHTLGS